MDAQEGYGPVWKLNIIILALLSFFPSEKMNMIKGRSKEKSGTVHLMEGALGQKPSDKITPQLGSNSCGAAEFLV